MSNVQARSTLLPVETPDGVVPTAAADRACLSFVVPGTPIPGGSKKAIPIGTRTGGYAHAANGRPLVAVADMSGERGKNWRAVVQLAARQAMNGRDLLHGPLWLGVELFMPRPRSHYRTGKRAGELKPNAPRWHTSAPDSTKCVRALEDSLNGVVWIDDRMVAEQHVTKEYGSHPCARISVAPLP